MARKAGIVRASIWNDPDFIALSVPAQRLYLFLLSQPDLSHAGLIPYRARRWASKVAEIGPDEIDADLRELQDARFVVTDEDTEEVLVRTFVRNDEVYRQPKVMLRMREDARQIESPHLRAAFAKELDRLPLDELSTEPPARGGPSCREQVEAVVNSLRDDFREASGRVSDTPSDGYAIAPRVRAGAFPQPPTPIPHPPAPVPPTAGSDESQPQQSLALYEDHEPTAQTFVAEWIEHCDKRPPGRVIGQVAKELKALLAEGIEPARVRAALIEWNSKGLHPSTLASVVHEISNRRPAARGQQATNDLFDRAMQRALDAERNAG